MNLFYLFFTSAMLTFLTIPISAQEIDESKLPEVEAGLKFVGEYIAALDDPNRDGTIIKWIMYHDDVTEYFKEHYLEIMTEGYENDPTNGLDYDPVLNAQDFPEEGFEFKSIIQEYGHMVLCGKVWKEFELDVRVVFKNDKWMIDGCGRIQIP